MKFNLILSISLCMFVCTLCHHAWSTSLDEIPRHRKIEDCESIASVAKNFKFGPAGQEKSLGFPFDDIGRVGYNGFTFIVGKRIKELHDGGLLEKGTRKAVLREIIESNSTKTKETEWHNAYINYGALQEDEPDLDLDLLLAAFSVCRLTGDMDDITPFLKFAKVCFGSDPEAMPGDDSDSIAESMYSENLTDEQRQRFGSS